MNRIAQIACQHFQGRLEVRVASLPLAFGSGIEAVPYQVEADAGDVLGHKFDWGDGFDKISVQRDVEARILRSTTVIGEI